MMISKSAFTVNAGLGNTLIEPSQWFALGKLPDRELARATCEQGVHLPEIGVRLSVITNNG